MKSLRILLIYSQDMLQQRARNFVWFLTMLIGPLTLLLFWRGSIQNGTALHTNVSLPEITSYYFLFAIAGSLLMAHPEEWIAEREINQGELSQFLLKPISYYKIKLINEVPWRIAQGFFGIIFFLGFLFFGNKVVFTNDAYVVLLSIIIMILAFFLSLTFKMLVGFTAFWTQSIIGLQDVIEVIMAIFGGFLMPLYLYPELLKKIASSLPFSYMLYYPVTAFQGRYQIQELVQIISVQILWLIFFFFLYRIVWSRGTKRFSAAGQ